MRILFVSSGNYPYIGDENGVLPITKNQGESIKKKVDLDYFTIKSKGVRGYLKYVFLLRRYLDKNFYDVIHAHYSLSAIVATLAKKNTPLVVSLMGSDIHMNQFWRFTIKLLHHLAWDITIVKSRRLQKELNLSKAIVIPNGVDFDKFIPINKSVAQKKIGFNPNIKHVIFVGDPTSHVKNFPLAKRSVHLLNNSAIKLFVIYFDMREVNQDFLQYYYNAADVLILTSRREGSPNVIKEAMACNCPIVSTDVGDVKEVIGNTDGCYISTFDAENVAEKINLAIKFGERTKGREKVRNLNIHNIADRLILIYRQVISDTKAFNNSIIKE